MERSLAKCSQGCWQFLSIGQYSCVSRGLQLHVIVPEMNRGGADEDGRGNVGLLKSFQGKSGEGTVEDGEGDLHPVRIKQRRRDELKGLGSGCFGARLREVDQERLDVHLRPWRFVACFAEGGGVEGAVGGGISGDPLRCCMRGVVDKKVVRVGGIDRPVRRRRG